MTPEEIKVAITRIAMVIQRSGGDHLGNVHTIHESFMQLIELIPRHKIVPVLKVVK